MSLFKCLASPDTRGGSSRIFLDTQNVLSLLLSAPAEVLFHRAMSQSGGIRLSSVSAGDDHAQALLLKLLVDDGSAADETSAAEILSGGKEDLYQVVASYSSNDWKASAVDQLAGQLRNDPGQPNVYAYQFLWGAGEIRLKTS